MKTNDDLLQDSYSHVESLQESVEDMRTITKEALVLLKRIESDIDLVHSARETSRKKLLKMTIAQAKTAKADIWSEEDDSNAMSRLYSDLKKLTKMTSSLSMLNTEAVKTVSNFESLWSNRYPISDKEYGF